MTTSSNVDDLPQGWAATTLGEICSKPQYGWTCRAAKEGKIKYVRTTDISDGGIDWASVPYCEEAPEDVEKYRVTQNDILVSRAGSVGVSFRIANVPCDAVFASYLIRFKPRDGIPPKYVEFFLNSDSYWRSISEFSAGIAVPNVNASKLASLEMPLAPLAEQRRIVAKLEKLLNQVDACQQRLEKMPTLLKRFRQSVLAAACSSRLTADWREENPQQPIELPKISSKRPLPPITEDEMLFDPPKTWRWSRLGSLAAFINGDRGKNYPNKNEYVPVGIPFINTGHIQPDGSLSAESMHHLTREKFDSLRSGKIQKGDLVYCLRGATLGKTAFVEPYDEGAIASSLVIVRVGEILDRKFLYYFLTSPFGKELVDRFDNGSAQPNLSADSVKNYVIALPSPAEQQEIVRRVAGLFALADQIEARLKTAASRVCGITPSLLARAFAGKLVPQDPTDEPASALLARIRADGDGAEEPRCREP